MIWWTPRSLALRPRVAELDGFTAELRRVAAALVTHTRPGPCDDTCGCTTDEPIAIHRPVVLGARRGDRDAPALACTLSANEVGDRLAQWEDVVAGSVGRDSIDGGTRLRFGRDVDIAALAALIAAEQDCCRFFTFTLTVGAESVLLDVTGPADAQPVIDALTGVAP